MAKGRREIRIFHPTAHQLYNYVLGRRFDPGAEAEAFEPLFALPEILARGPSIPAGSLMVTQHPQVWFHQQVGVQGVGGLVAGGIRLQPLLDPEQFEGA